MIGAYIKVIRADNKYESRDVLTEMASFRISHNSKYIATHRVIHNADLPGARMLDIETGEEILSVPHNNSGVPDIAFSPDDRFLAVAWGGGSKHGLEIWDIQKKQVVYTYSYHPKGGYNYINFSNAGNYLSCGTSTRLYLYLTPWIVSVPNEPKLKAFISFPNLTKNIINLEFELSKPDKTKIDVLDIKGKLIKNLIDLFLPEGRQRFTFDLGDLPGGTYFLRIQSGNSVFSKKILINK